MDNNEEIKEVSINISSDKSILGFGMNGLKEFKSVNLPNGITFVGITKELSEYLENRVTDKDFIEKGYFEFLNGDILERSKIELIGSKRELMPFVKSYIPVQVYHNHSERIGYGNTSYRHEWKMAEYYCCTSSPEKRNKFNNVVIHEDYKSSFNCICEFLKADYILVLNNK